MKLFVYGTLKRGFCRHPALEGQAYVGETCTKMGYRMYNVGDYPALVSDAEGGQIAGEIWQVSDVCLAQLDEIEGNWFRRETVRLEQPFQDEHVQAYFFQQPVTGLTDCGRCWK
jgi:gamma-glutamylcyclotransferase (GGCT)/AIG2-like uncharacterized protein YtfP